METLSNFNNYKISLWKVIFSEFLIKSVFLYAKTRRMISLLFALTPISYFFNNYNDLYFDNYIIYLVILSYFTIYVSEIVIYKKYYFLSYIQRKHYEFFWLFSLFLNFLSIKIIFLTLLLIEKDINFYSVSTAIWFLFLPWLSILSEYEQSKSIQDISQEKRIIAFSFLEDLENNFFKFSIDNNLNSYLDDFKKIKEIIFRSNSSELEQIINLILKINENFKENNIYNAHQCLITDSVFLKYNNENKYDKNSQYNLNINHGILKNIIIDFIHAYRKSINLNNKRKCRFYPSCSEYAEDAFSKYGVIKGFKLFFLRALKCVPNEGSGFDPVP